jgi:hypothetical protein
MLSVGGVNLYLAKVLFLSSLGLLLLRVDVSTNLGKGFLKNPHLLFPRGEGLLPATYQPSPVLVQLWQGYEEREEEWAAQSKHKQIKQCSRKHTHLSQGMAGHLPSRHIHPVVAHHRCHPVGGGGPRLELLSWGCFP